jgi:hypothetical protein
VVEISKAKRRNFMIYGAYNCYQQAIKPLNLYYKALGHISALPFPPPQQNPHGEARRPGIRQTATGFGWTTSPSLLCDRAD